MKRPTRQDAMKGIWDFAAANGRGEALFGDGAARAIEAYRCFLAGESFPNIGIEFPLLGDPGYDVLVGPYKGGVVSGDVLGEKDLPVAQAALEWMASWDGDVPVDLFFELDATAPGGRQAGVLCKHSGQPRAAAEFLEAVGASHFTSDYLAFCGRLPEGWDVCYAGLFPGRAQAGARVELFLQDDAREQVADNPEYLRTCFDRIGFAAYSDSMLASVTHLVAIGPMPSFQFDIARGGIVGGTFSAAFFFEDLHTSYSKGFAPGGMIAEVCGEFQRMGIADDRWRLVEGASFARATFGVDDEGVPFEVQFASIPCCAKAKWKSGRACPAKFYQGLALSIADA